jgi:formiminoglutamase
MDITASPVAPLSAASGWASAWAAARPWTGRNDGDAPRHHRWHQAVRPLPAAPESLNWPDRLAAASGHDAGPSPAVLLGFRSDEGVRRNQGRTGAADAPEAIRGALSSLAFPADGAVFDAGDITVQGTDLENAQQQLGAAVTGVLDGGGTAVVLGGGHETAYGSYLGLAGFAAVRGGARMGVLNLDAHFDLRADPVPSSGTPFRQMAEAEARAGRRLRYGVVGISEANNTPALFDAAAALDVPYLLDEDCGVLQQDYVRAFVRRFLDGVDVVYLTVDLDVLPAAVAPGVSAPAGLGVPLEVIHAVCRQVAESGKLAVFDVVELNPRFDVDGRTARVAARLVDTVVRRRRSLAANYS